MSDQPLAIGRPRVFVLHADEQTGPADDLKRELHRRGAEVVSHRRLSKDQPWTAALARELARSDLVVVLLSYAEHSRDLLYEVGQAVASRGRERVVIVALSDETAHSLPSDLQGYLYVRADAAGMAPLADRLLSTLPNPPHAAAEAETAVFETLSRLAMTWEREPAVGGVRPDVLARAADGRRVVIEFKAAAQPTVLDVADARAQAARLAEVTGADLGLAVFALEHLPFEAGGAVGFHDVEKALARLRPTAGSAQPSPEVINEAKTIFAAMPFAAEFEDVYFVAMVEAAKLVGAACRRLDREDYTGDIISKLTQMIRGADAVVADISDANPNVLYEVGYAHALGIPAVHICSTPLANLPFDVRNWNTMQYERGRTHALRADLTQRLLAALN